MGPGLEDGPSRPGAEHFTDGVFFAKRGRPWQRPTNENSGTLRQYVPKGCDLSVDTVEDRQRAERLLNTRPRRVLDWKTLAAVFDAGLSC